MSRPSSRRALADILHLLALGVVLSALTIVLVRYGADSVGGADSAGYLAQARRWRQAELVQPVPFPNLPGADAAWLQTPLGFRPGPAGATTVPTYPPGWPLLMAAALTAGHTAAVRVLPAACALLALVALYLLGRTVTTRWHAVAAVACAASLSPFLFQALQPMSDVPAMAAWLVALAGASRGPSRTSLAVAAAAPAVALTVRPNLAPLLLAVAWLTWQHTSWQAGPRVIRRALLRVGVVVLPAAVVALAYIGWQAALYGSPWQSGYGTADELFSPTYVLPNLEAQARWLRQSLGSPTLLMLALGALGALRPGWPRPLALAIAIGWLLYLVYVPFDNWTYLRFVLLPLTLLVLSGVATVDALTRRSSTPVRGAAVVLAVIPCIWTNTAALGPLGVFEMHRHEWRYRAASAFVHAQPAANIVVLAGQHSGAAAAYTPFPVIRTDLLTAADAAATIPYLQTHGYTLAIVLDDEEVADVRARLGGSGIGLDWPPRARVGRPGRARVWYLADQALIRHGGHVTTLPLWPARR